MAEILTVFDRNMNVKGEKERSLVHLDGDWHETFHCWLFEEKGNETYVYFQKRAENKKEFPGLFDITAAGHVEAGESVLSAGVREVKEEIGTTVDEKDLINMGMFQEELISSTLIDREICNVYMLSILEKLEFIIGEEVTDIIKINLRDWERLLDDDCTCINGTSVLNEKKLSLRKDDFVPHEEDYYRFIITQIAKNVEKL
ncbi:NUDIX hydrolase [Halobacillus yeomjeoni]|uniref:NUDIX domain-containing protein n=1 Tax=Halobacillus yeomjeoni TaxID=311194 RepID=A0A931HY90_9BACI|nr:NUDIX domain-containing protein [Halobacillus yeomjeoni]MBH0231639.1 NUDIX domain-containing protein [Halobacillus yeomjeoni]